MSTKKNKAMLMNLVERLFNQGDTTICDSCVAADYIFHGPAGEEASGPSSMKQRYLKMRAAFPDLKMDLIDMTAEGDTVLHRWLLSGTNTGPLEGMPPTGKTMSVPVWILSRIKNNKEVEGWELYNQMVSMQQLGMSMGPQQ